MKKDFAKDIPHEQNWWQPGILVFARLSVWIVTPVLLGVLVGKWLDNKFNSEPWIFLFSTGTAFLVSMFGLAKNTIAEYKKIEREEKEKKNSNKT